MILFLGKYILNFIINTVKSKNFKNLLTIYLKLNLNK